MEWFRWYHGTVSDPKFSVIAKRAKQPRHVVIACWPAILEYASTRADRGGLVDLDLEEVAVVLDLDIEQVEAVYQAMVDKEMIVDDRLKNWEKRQPKREDATGRERKEKWKKKQCTEAERIGTQENETPRTERARTEQNRTEQTREEETSSSSPLEEMPTKAPSPPEQTATRMTIIDLRFLHHESFGTNMPGGCAEIAAQVCQEFTADAIREAFKTAAVHGKPTMAYVRGVLKGNGKDKPARASPPGPVSFEQAKSERTKQAAQAFVERKRAECQTTTTSFSGQSSPDSPRLLESSAVSSE